MLSVRQTDRQTIPCGMENHAMRLSPSKKSPGFTLLEIVVVLLVLGIVSTVVVSRYVNADADAQNAALMGKISSHLRYARNASMNSDTTWWIDFDSGAYRLYRRDAAGTDTSAVFPGEDEPVVDLPDGFGPNISVYFDDWGRPANNSGVPITTAFGLAFSGGTITIEPTGYIR